MRGSLAIATSSSLGRLTFAALLVATVLVIAGLTVAEGLGQTGVRVRLRRRLDLVAVALGLVVGALVVLRFVAVR